MLKHIKMNPVFQNGLFFDIALLCYMVQALSKITYFGQDIINLSLFAVFVPLLCILQEAIFGSHTRNSYIVLGLFCLFTLAQVIYGGKNLIALFLLLYTSRTLPLEHVLRTLLTLLTGALAITVFLAECGIITNSIAYRENSSLARYGLGFIGWTYSSYFLFVASSLYAILKKQNAKWYVLFVVLIVNCWLYLQTNTRNGFVLTLVVLLVEVIAKLRTRKSSFRLNDKPILACVASTAFVLAFLLMILLVALYPKGGTGIEAVNGFMSQRISYTCNALNQFGISIFGNSIDWSSLNYIVDNSYFRIVIEYGVISAIVIISIMTIASLYSSATNDYISLIICVLFAIFFSFDPIALTAFLNPVLFIGVNALSSGSFDIRGLFKQRPKGKHFEVSQKHQSRQSDLH